MADFNPRTGKGRRATEPATVELLLATFAFPVGVLGGAYAAYENVPPPSTSNGPTTHMIDCADVPDVGPHTDIVTRFEKNGTVRAVVTQALAETPTEGTSKLITVAQDIPDGQQRPDEQQTGVNFTDDNIFKEGADTEENTTILKDGGCAAAVTEYSLHPSEAVRTTTATARVLDGEPSGPNRRFTVTVTYDMLTVPAHAVDNAVISRGGNPVTKGQTALQQHRDKPSR